MDRSSQIHSLYHSFNIVSVLKFRILRWARDIARMEEVRGTFKIITGKAMGKRPLGRPRLGESLTIDMLRMLDG